MEQAWVVLYVTCSSTAYFECGTNRNQALCVKNLYLIRLLTTGTRKKLVEHKLWAVGNRKLYAEISFLFGEHLILTFSMLATWRSLICSCCSLSFWSHVVSSTAFLNSTWRLLSLSAASRASRAASSAASNSALPCDSEKDKVYLRLKRRWSGCTPRFFPLDKLEPLSRSI